MDGLDCMEVTPLVDSAPLLDRPDALRARAEADGYLYLSSVHAPESVGTLRSLVLAASSRHGWLAPGTRADDAIARAGIESLAFDDPSWIALQAEVYPSVEMNALRMNPIVIQALRTLFRAEVSPHQGDICRLLFPNAPHRATSPHQDGAFVGTENPCWTVWSPLGDCPLALGPLALQRGSHAAGLVPHSRDEHAGFGAIAVKAAGWVASDLRCGDALLFHPLTMHASLPNRSPDRVRVSIDCRYRRQDPEDDDRPVR